MTKEAKYFCEFCDTEVGENDKVCPKCGRSFSSVVCASCGYSGTESEFAGGCPKCGYAEKSIEKKSLARNREKKKEFIPWWVFFAAGVVLGMLLILGITRRQFFR